MSRTDSRAHAIERAAKLRAETALMKAAHHQASGATAANGFLEPGIEMITKPFAIEALATRIRDMISGQR